MTTLPSSPGALAGIKVLDLSRVLAGPWCTQMLADLGADVIKVERPSAGNDTNQASYFTAGNRNKRSVTIDMATAPRARRSSGRWPCRPASWCRTSRSAAPSHTASTTKA